MVEMGGITRRREEGGGMGYKIHTGRE